MKKFIFKYKAFILMTFVYGLVFLVQPDLFYSSSDKSMSSFIEMMLVIPPVFILLGLLDVWVSKETMVKAMGKGSGLKGVLLAFFLGSAAAGPLYAAFPVAIALLKKGSSFHNVLILIGAWSTTKIPMLVFEASSMGLEFTLIRFALNIAGIWGIAFISVKLLGEHEEARIHQRILHVE